MLVKPIHAAEARAVVVAKHYLHRAPPVSYAFGLYSDGSLVGVVIFGIPASHHLRMSACRADPSLVIELNRLWVCDTQPRNSESFFVARALKLLPPRIIVSYADTAHGHAGYVYRALNFRYAGWSDMERKTPRFDYVVPGKHSRDAFRDRSVRAADIAQRIRRKPKVRYWTVTGNRRERTSMARMCTWPSLSWKELPPPQEAI